MKKAIFTLFVALALVAAAHAEVIEQVLVKVNGEIITKSDLEKLQIAAFRELPNRPDPTRMSDADLAKALAQITPQAIVSAVDDMLLMQRAKDLGLAVSDEQFNNVLESIKKDNKMETEEQFQAALRQEGLTLPQLRQTLTKRMLISQVQQREVVTKIDVNDAELREYYDKNPTEFGTTPSVTLREILITVPLDPEKGLNAGLQDEKKKKADEERARAAKGESFEKLVGEVSESPSKANGGLIGPISRSEMDESLLKLLSTMKVGDISQVVQVPNGFAVFKLEANVESTTLPFESAKGAIADKLGQEKVRGEMRKYMTRLRAQAIIDWKDPELKKAYDAGVSGEPTF